MCELCVCELCVLGVKKRERGGERIMAEGGCGGREGGEGERE